MIRKHHNAHKRAQAVFSNVRLWSWESMREDGVQIAHGMARVGFVWRDLNQKQVTGIIDKTNNWVIVCRALYCLIRCRYTATLTRPTSPTISTTSSASTASRPDLSPAL